MGVPRLWPFIKEKFFKAIYHFRSGTYSYVFDYVYLDANPLLHEAAQFVENYGKHKRLVHKYKHLSLEERRTLIFEKFFDNIAKVLNMINPSKVLYIAIDGPAPRAKQAQQRERRFISALARIIHESETGESFFDTASISPGTVFMHELSKFMFWAIRERIQTKEGWQNIQVIFSPSSVSGEGEHKILSYIRSLSQHEKDHGTHCMFGPDGDLLMLTLSAHVKNMNLFREDQTKHTRVKTTTKGNDSSSETGGPDYVDMVTMSIVRKGLVDELGQSKAIRSRQRTENDVSNDFVVIGFFVGNDFLPKIKMIYRLDDGLQKMFDVYYQMCSKDNYLTTNNELSIENLTMFIAIMSEMEEKEIANQAFVMVKQEKFEDTILLKHSTIVNEKIVKINISNYRKAYYANMGITSEEGISHLCQNYLRVLIWVYKYYTDKLASWDEAYTWYYAPLMSDLSVYLKELTKPKLTKISHFELSYPALPFEQLLSILSPYSSNLLPEHFRWLINNENSCLVKIGYYPKTFEIDYEGRGKDEEWDEHKGIAILPFVSYDIISKAYKQRNKSSKYKYHRNEFGRNYIFKYDPSIKNIEYISDYGKIKECHVLATPV